MKKTLSFVSSIAVLLLLIGSTYAQTKRFVKPTASGTGDGSSWANASSDLQAMMNASGNGDQVWVAKGTYKPTSGTDRTVSFVMKPGVKVYGSFSGNETTLTERTTAVIVANPSVLSGDLKGDDVVTGKGETLVISNNSENSQNVVLNWDNGLTADNSCLDGFVISGGNALQGRGGGMLNYNSAPVLRNIIFKGNAASNAGGGLFVTASSDATITNVVFEHNIAAQGGGMMDMASTMRIQNAIFVGNKAREGGGLYVYVSKLTMVGVVLVENDGSGVFFDESTNSSKITNTIFFRNSLRGSTFAEGIDVKIVPTGGFVYIENSLLQLTSDFYSGKPVVVQDANNLFAIDPLLANSEDLDGGDDIYRTADDGLRLSLCSPLINAGTDVNNQTTDILDNPRKVGDSVDIGAYERQESWARTPTVKAIDPSSCSNDGRIILGDLVAGAEYTLSYRKNTVSSGFFLVSADVNGQVILSSLNSGLYTDIQVERMGCLTDKVNVTIKDSPRPSITLGTIPEVCYGVPSFEIPYTSTTGTPVTYSISGDNIVTVTDAPLPASSITVMFSTLTSLKQTLDFVLTVKNANGCASEAIINQIKFKSRPEASIRIVEPDCINDGSIQVTLKDEALAKISYSVGGTDYGVGGTVPVPFSEKNDTAIVAIPKGNMFSNIFYIKYEFDYLNCITSGTLPARLTLITNCCPILPTLELPQTLICANSPFSMSAKNMSSMESFDVAGVDYGVKFVYFSSPTNDPYTGGTSIGSVDFANLQDDKRTAVLSNNTLPAGTYYVYAILSTLPNDNTCRPYAQGVLVVYPKPSISTVPIAAICATNSTLELPYTTTAHAPVTYSLSGVGINAVQNAPILTSSLTAAVSPGATTIAYSLTVASAVGCTSDAVTGTVSVTPTTVGGIVEGSTTLCVEAKTTKLRLVGQVGTILKWQSAANASFSTSVDIANTTSEFVPNSIAQNTYYRAVVQNGVCAAQTSTNGVVVVQVKPTITLSVLQQTLNEGNSQTFCDTDANPVNGLQFTVSGLCVVGNPVWRVQVGSGAWSDWSATAPVSQPSNNQPHRYQAACEASCPSTYTSPIELTINYRSSVPQNVSLLVDGVTVAVGETKEVCSLVNTNLTFNANCAAGEILLYSVDGGEYSTGVPVGLVDNQFHNYRVRCRKSDGTPSCVESESGVMRLKLVVIPAAPMVSLSSTSSCNPSASFSGQSTCGSLRTVWYNATTNVALPSLPATVPSQTTSYYARCQTENGCVSEKSNVVTFTLTPTQVAPVITVSQEIVCTGTTVTISANCPAGSQTFWNTGVTAPSFEVAFNNVTKQTYWAKCLFEGGCQSSESVRKDVYWNAFVVTLINIGESKSAVKPANDKSLWTSQFIKRDGGPELEQSTQVNPTLFYVENANKMAPRYWTINVEACGLSTDGSLTFDMLATPEMGVIRSFNTHENNAPYFMYANREGWTELYGQNHPAYGFYQDNGAGGNVYDAGLPKGLYKLGIRYWDQKGWGSIYPSTRKPQGNVLAYQEYWFRIQSRDGVGVGAARTAEQVASGQGARGEGQEANGKGADNGQPITDNGAFATVLPNPVSNILRLKVQDSKGQVVQSTLMDAAGREVLRRQFTPDTNTHQEEFGVSELPTGMYFLKVTTADQQATLKVVKVQQ
ncbi:T9SS type A sorting domain-containing protein [Runella sp. SP2]|uniref:T9SS type A sorting domain-containing protein n=1 Tax=Runella sp. SP2 TaxID=2268026 RepID=UPI0013DE49DA|nr:T9SS type A sorting domain-containing protein [Runella sp. SP2]